MRAYILPALVKELNSKREILRAERIFEPDCGNGSIANVPSHEGCEIVGVDPSLRVSANQTVTSLRLN